MEFCLKLASVLSGMTTEKQSVRSQEAQLTGPLAPPTPEVPLLRWILRLTKSEERVLFGVEIKQSFSLENKLGCKVMRSSFEMKLDMLQL